MSDVVAGSLGMVQRRLLLSAGCNGGRGKRRGEQVRGVSGTRGKGELFGGALLLEPHEAMAEGGRKGGQEQRWKRRAKPWARGTDGWAPRGFDFFSNLCKMGSTLKIQNGCLILLKKFLIFACVSLGFL
jgi:hypothetical protein